VKRPLLALAVSAGLLAGCGTGLEARTYQESGREDGAVADVGGRTGIAIRHLHVEGPAKGSTLDAGSTAVVLGAFVNNGPVADALVSATSEVAGSSQLLLDGKPVTAIPVPAFGSAGTTWSIRLIDLKGTLHVGQYVGIHLSFAKAGRVSLRLPLHAGDNGLDTREVSQDPYSHGEGESHEEPSAPEDAAPDETAPEEGAVTEETSGH